ncbi:hypothetical protein [Novosphingobium sp. Fuku2-ISO-50]|nr:hypothetical protein [Novosphingobium sp. Fuku2-ISO-50]
MTLPYHNGMRQARARHLAGGVLIEHRHAGQRRRIALHLMGE